MWLARTLPCSMSGLAKRVGSPLTEGTLVSRTSSCPSSFFRMNLPESLQFSLESIPVSMFADSGLDDNFIDESLVKQSLLPVELLKSPRTVNALDGRKLATITHRTIPITLTISGNHREIIWLLVITSPCSPVVLGLPWLRLHNPHIDWTAASISNWSPFCHSNYLCSAISTIKRLSAPPLKSPDLSLVPPEYHNLAMVFCKERARTLPPHRP